MNSFLERNSSIIAWLAGLGLPMAVIIAGWIITNGAENSKRESEYVQIALNILARSKGTTEKYAPFNEDEVALRQWAVRLLNRNAPEKFTEEEQKALLNTRQSFGNLTEEDKAALSVLAWGWVLKMLLESVKDKDGTPTPTPQPQPQPQRLPGPAR